MKPQGLLPYSNRHATAPYLHPDKHSNRHATAPYLHPNKRSVSQPFFFLARCPPRPFQFLSEDLFGHSILLNLSRWHIQLILCPFIHFTIFSPLLISSSSQFVRLFHSSFSYLGPYVLLNIFLSKISRACSSFFVIVHTSAPYDTTGLVSVLYNRILVAALDKSRLLKRLTAAK